MERDFAAGKYHPNGFLRKFVLDSENPTGWKAFLFQRNENVCRVSKSIHILSASRFASRSFCAMPRYSMP